MAQRAALPIRLLFAAGMLLYQPSTAQTFQRTYGGSGLDEGRHVLVLEDGDLLITGRTTSAGPGTESLWLMRTNSIGEPIWSFTYGGQFSEVGLRARVHPDSGFVVLGHTDNSWGGLRNLYLLRIADDGTLLWSRSIGSSSNDDASDLLVLPDGGYLLTGNSGAFGGRRVLVARLDAAGELVWVRQIASPGNDNGLALAAAADGGFIVVGSTQGLGPGQIDMIAVRYDPSGNQLWLRTLGGPQADRALSVQPTPEGDWLVGGNTNSFGNGAQNILLARLSDAGELAWAKVYGGDRQDILRSMVLADGGGFLISGLLFNTLGQAQDHALLMRVNDGGEVLWSRTYGAVGGFAEHYGMARIDEGFVATGARADANGDLDLLLLRTDASGQSGCDQAEVLMSVIEVTLTVTSPTPTAATMGITSSVPPTETSQGPLALTTPCLDLGTGMSPTAAAARLAVSPNPATDQLWIGSEGTNPAIQLFDARGVLVWQGTLDQRTIDIHSLPPGLYTGWIERPQGKETFRFVKE
jgi:outer membrane protein assembly factor BamB